MNSWESLETTQRGNEAEQTARDVIIKHYDVTILNITNSLTYKHNLYDFQTSDGLKYEVKADRIADRTHNFFIEYVAYNKPSGISITTADKWMLTYNNNFFIIRIDELNRLFEKCNVKAKVRANNTLGKLIAVHDVLAYATILPF
jgi:hypothetical protein